MTAPKYNPENIVVGDLVIFRAGLRSDLHKPWVGQVVKVHTSKFVDWPLADVNWGRGRPSTYGLQEIPDIERAPIVDAITAQERMSRKKSTS